MHPFAVAEATPDVPAVIMAASGASLTYAQLAERTRCIQHLLRSLGVERGDCIALFSENMIDFLPIVWAAQSSGLHYTAINSHLTPEEVAYIVNDSGAVALFSTENLTAVAATLDQAAIPYVKARVMAGSAAPGWIGLDDALAGQPSASLDGSCEGDFFLYSSGTTGRPKGVRRPLSFRPLGEGFANVSGMRSSLAAQGIEPGSIYLATAPLYHAAPLSAGLGVTRIGGTVLVMEKFDAQFALELIDKYRVSSTQMVPTMFVRMLKLSPEVRSRYDLSSLRSVMHTGAPCPIDVKRSMIDWLGPVINEIYASTEGVGVTYITSEEWLKHPGSVGRPMIGVAHVADESGVELPPGEDGTIWFEGGSAFEYHNDKAETGQARNGRGWSTVGDIGHIDDDGYMYLSERKAFMIISGGVNIYPQEIENVLIVHPKVVDVAVFGVPNEEFGEEVKAVVQLEDLADASPALAAELIEYCRSRLAGYKVPRSIEFTEQLPRLDSGKLYKRILRDKYWPVASNKTAL